MSKQATVTSRVVYPQGCYTVTVTLLFTQSDQARLDSNVG